ncbi:tumor necrosis factor receptor superfamily member 5 isoform X2 [Mastacembelus armatus]|uniref:tumor necrosis factor receptor superfamily member 5 isoform X2 n=1 Tax=Mastacembelus armatus TaxID=205130 RepID=UPI000E4645F0|nr:tumor necrosis factor receptor superfamily member 5-like isoform X2 [Mastacembelus armatus]
MLHFTIHYTKMPSVWMAFLMIWDVMVMTTAQPRCDPLTQYEQNGQCCKMCGPGTSMLSTSSCLEPQCKECGEREYQDKYTKELNCLRQPYCDPNKNFEVSGQWSKKKKTVCMCKLGFHCSSEECLTCVPHTQCKPGYGAKSIGNHTRDTLCHKCPEGTFSNMSSWNRGCEEWTTCGRGYSIQQRGTDRSDTICEKTSRTHMILMCVFIPIGIIALGVVGYCLCKGGAREKGYAKPCCGDKGVTLEEIHVGTQTPEKAPILPQGLSSQEDGGTRTPEENDDSLSQEPQSEPNVILSDKGNFVTQENGKSDILSRQESQTQTFID